MKIHHKLTFFIAGVLTAILIFACIRWSDPKQRTFRLLEKTLVPELYAKQCSLSAVADEYLKNINRNHVDLNILYCPSGIKDRLVSNVFISDSNALIFLYNMQQVYGFDFVFLDEETLLLYDSE